MAVATTTLIATAVVLAATAVSAYSSSASAAAQQDAAKFNAAVQRNQALAATEQSSFDAQRIRDRNLRLMATQQAAYTKSGVAISGSAQDVMYDSQIQGEMDSLAALYTGRVSADSATARARLSSMEAANAERAGVWGTAGTVLGGVSSAGSLVSTSVTRNQIGRG